MANSLHDPKQNTMAGKGISVVVSITDTAQSVRDLVTASLPTGKVSADIQQVMIGQKDTNGTARGAILIGGSTPSYYIPSDVEYPLFARGGDVYLKRAAGSDVAAVLLVWLD